MFFQKFLNAKMAEVVKRGSYGIMVPVPPGKRHQTFSQIPGQPPPDLPCRHTGNDGIGLDIVRNDRIGGNDRPVSNGRLRLDDGGVTYPGVVADKSGT